jgi:DegV family protein with EDD domain
VTKPGRIRIVTDSVSDLPPPLAQRLGIRVLPVYVSLHGKNYRDDGTLDRDWFYETLRQDGVEPSTGAPAMEDFRKAYGDLAAGGAEEIIGLFVGGGLSSVMSIAQIAAEGFSGARVHILETGQVTMGLGWMVVEAAEAAAQGANVAEIARLITGLRQRTYVMGVLNSLKYLSRSGRVGWTTGWVGDLLRVKPLILFTEGEAELYQRVRTHRRALSSMVSWVEEQAPLARLALLHSNVSPEVLEELRSRLDVCLPRGEILEIEVGPVFGAHVGPDALGVALTRVTS